MPRQWEEDLPVNTQMGRKMLFLLILLMLMAGFTFFISGRLRRPHAIPADFSHLQSILEQENLYGKTQMGSEAVLKRNFGILPASCAEVLYLAPDSFMDVDELLLIRFPEPEAAEPLRQSIEKRLDILKNKFENYGTDQYSLLQRAMIYQNEAYICYASGTEAEAWMRLVRQAIER